MLLSSSNRVSARARASSVFPTPVGPRKRNEPIGRFGSLMPARARTTASATARTASSWPTTRWWSSSSRCRSFCSSPSISFVTGMPVHRDTTSAMSSSSTSSLRSRRPPPAAACASASLSSRSSVASVPYWSSADLVQVVRPHRLLDLDLDLLDALAELTRSLDGRPSPLPLLAEGLGLGLQARSSSSSLARRSRDGASLSFFSASRSISSCIVRRVISSSSAGIESISVRSRAAASSMRIPLHPDRRFRSIVITHSDRS